MVYSKDDFLRDLAIYSTGAAVGIKNTGKFLAYAGRKGISLGTMGARTAAPPVARGIGSILRRNPAIFAGLTVAEAYRMGLLDEPIERGRDIFADTTAQAIETVDPFMPQGPPPGFQGFRVKAKRKPSKYNKAVKAGMAAVKNSKFGGKKGKISNAKSTFATVNKVASAVNKGKKVAAKGIRGVAARAMRRIL